MTALLDALSFLTILPLPCPLVSDRAGERMVRALAWFPLVGALAGALAGGIAWATWNLWGQAIGAWLGLAALAVITGGLHLDGFADTMDGLGAWKGRQETLEVMRDSRIGAHGAAALIFLLAVQWSALRQMTPHFWPVALAAIGALSRLGLVLSAQIFPYAAGKSGIGRLVTDRRSPRSVAVACCFGLGIAAVCLGFPRALCLLAGVLALSGLSNLFFLRWLGGITGTRWGR